MKETELYLPVKGWLENQGFEVFPEVQLHAGMNIIDVVGIHKPVVVAVELKTSFSLTAIEQAIKDKNFAHKCYVAVPFYQRIVRKGRYVEPSDHHFATKICEQYGVGVLRLYFSRETNKYQSIEEIVPAKFNRKYCIYDKHILATCDESRKNFNQENNIVAGTKGGGHLTAYKVTIQNVIDYLKVHGKATAKELVNNIHHHYRGMNPDSSLRSAIFSFELNRFETLSENGKTYFLLKENQIN
jgi:hypothetical protein